MLYFIADYFGFPGLLNLFRYLSFRSGGAVATALFIGLMHRRLVPRTGTGLNGFEPTVSVDDLDAVITAVKGHGGRVTMPKSGIPTVGTLVRFEDTEGNDVGAMKYETPPRQ